MRHNLRDWMRTYIAPRILLTFRGGWCSRQLNENNQAFKYIIDRCKYCERSTHFDTLHSGGIFRLNRDEMFSVTVGTAKHKSKGQVVSRKRVGNPSMDYVRLNVTPPEIIFFVSNLPSLGHKSTKII